VYDHFSLPFVGLSARHTTGTSVDEAPDASTVSVIPPTQSRASGFWQRHVGKPHAGEPYRSVVNGNHLHLITFQTSKYCAVSAKGIRAMAQRALRKFTIVQARRHLKAITLELAAIGGAFDQSAGELRRRILATLGTLHELIARFPTKSD
jgi:hypothetical protein